MLMIDWGLYINNTTYLITYSYIEDKGRKKWKKEEEKK
jgi:hypothetical protein